MKGGEKNMALFQPITPAVKVPSDPFLDAVVSVVTDDNHLFANASAIKNSDIFTAIRIIAQDIATNPIQLIKDGEPKQDNDLYYLLNVRPNDEMDAWHFKFSLAANMLLNGNSFAEIKRSDNGKIEELLLLSNSTVTVTQDDTTRKVMYTVVDSSSKSKSIDAKDILHFKYFSQDGLTGVSPLHALGDEMKVQRAGNKTLFNFFSRGVNGSGILKINKSDLDKEAKDAIREKFEEANGSSNGDNALRTIILDETMEYKPLEVNTDVLRLVNSNDWTSKQIAKVYGIPNNRLGVEDVHSNTVQSNLMYIQNTLGHYFSSFTSELDMKLITKESKSYLEFDTTRLLSTDPATQQEIVIKGIQGSLYSVNEGRKKLKLPPVEGGDQILASLNYTPLDNLLDYQLKNQEGEGTSNE